jgi:preprotein translocase subunit SecA
MITKLLAKILGTNNERQLKQLRGIVERINYLEAEISILTDDALALKTNYFREQLSQGKHLDDILPEAFAVVREVAKRKLGQRHYDVQLMGGIVLHQGKIAEMKTGEGKTLTATLPLYLNALAGKGAHLVTVNEYLASRDSQWMAPVYNALGLSVTALRHSMQDEERKAAYQSDILYATNSELGFDYLRDNMKFRLEDYVQRDLNFAIVDEVDSILIDEARTPLIISGSANKSSKLYEDTNRVVTQLQKDVDYEVDEKSRNVQLTETGNDKIERIYNLSNIYAVENLNLIHHLQQALRAHAIFKRDVDYVVKDDQVLIVDEFTGRILSGRRYSDGLHQALEAKEGVTIERESQTLASITLQNYFRIYTKLAGMTGTAATEAEEFYNIYKLHVLSIPTNKPLIRDDRPDLIFLTKNAKYKAIVEDIQERHAKGQPVLIGTVAVETSELISAVLRQHGIAHEVLNAKQHEREADIVEKAGEPGHITIATNMAGRGTDIKLPQASKDAGGLYILGTERHESRRIDNQLRGRSGRQGDPGESRFYISLEDDLIRIFAGNTLKRNMERFGMAEDEVIESPYVSKKIEQAQERVEKDNYETRKHLLEYDDVLNQQRTIIYQYRREVLEGENQIADLIRDFIIKAVQSLVERLAPKRELTQPVAESIFEAVSRLTGLPKDDFEKAGASPTEPLAKTGISKKTSEALQKDMINFLLEKYSLYRNQEKLETVQQAEKWLMLETIDKAWKQHMLNLDHLKEGIGLRKNPLIEYKSEAYDMFKELLAEVQAEVVHHIFHLNLERFNSRELEESREREMRELKLAGPSEDTIEAPVQRDEPKVGRNDACPCGSGEKYKKCCGK